MMQWAPQIGLAMFVAMVVLMALRVPIAAAMFIPGLLGYGLMSDSATALNFLKGSAVARLTVYELSVIPLFLLMGQFATQGGLSRDLFKAAAALVGHVRGGLAMASVLSAGAFGAVCGSSVATSATITQVAYPEMRRFGYPQSFSTGVIAAGGTLGAMLPPSTVLAVYAILTQQDIGKLFMAGIIPGLLAMAMYVLTISVIVQVKPDWLPRGEATTWAQRFAGLKDVWAPLLLFVFVIGGLYGGFFTPTGFGTELAKYADGTPKETREIDGRMYVYETPIHADLALIKAERGDRWGNLTYRKAARNFGPVMAMAARKTVASVHEIVELGALDPEHIVTPGIFVKQVVRVERKATQAGGLRP